MMDAIAAARRAADAVWQMSQPDYKHPDEKVQRDLRARSFLDEVLPAGLGPSLHIKERDALAHHLAGYVRVADGAKAETLYRLAVERLDGPRPMRWEQMTHMERAPWGVFSATLALIERAIAADAPQRDEPRPATGFGRRTFERRAKGIGARVPMTAAPAPEVVAAEVDEPIAPIARPKKSSKRPA